MTNLEPNWNVAPTQAGAVVRLHPRHIHARSTSWGRRAEMVALQVENLIVEPDTLLIRKSKSDQEGFGAIVPVPSDVMRYFTR